MSEWDPQSYDRRWAEMAEAGKDPHGEVAFIERLIPRLGINPNAPILDAGCGTGRVAIELDRRGYPVEGTDIDATMLARAAEKGPALRWTQANLAQLALSTSFDLIVLAGNVILFADEPDRPFIPHALCAHSAEGGVVVAGFQLARSDGRRVALSDWDTWMHDAGFALIERFATWDDDPWDPAGDYAVSVHRRR